MKNKPFDCVEMKREGAKKIVEQTSKMSKSEELAFWQRHSDELQQLQRAGLSRLPHANHTTPS